MCACVGLCVCEVGGAAKIVASHDLKSVWLLEQNISMKIEFPTLLTSFTDTGFQIA